MSDNSLAWQFDHFKVMTTLADIITSIVGEHLADIPNSVGQKVSLSNYQNISAVLPKISLNYQGSTDDGFVIRKGLVEVDIEDPNDPLKTIKEDLTYLDKLTNFIVTVRAESMPAAGYDDKANAHRLLRDIRKNLLLPKYRKILRDVVFTGIEFINPVRSTPDLVATSYHDICTMQLKLSTVDRVIDYDATTFNTINYVGIIAEDGKDYQYIISGNPTSI